LHRVKRRKDELVFTHGFNRAQRGRCPTAARDVIQRSFHDLLWRTTVYRNSQQIDGIPVHIFCGERRIDKPGAVGRQAWEDGTQSHGFDVGEDACDSSVVEPFAVKAPLASASGDENDIPTVRGPCGRELPVVRQADVAGRADSSRVRIEIGNICAEVLSLLEKVQSLAVGCRGDGGDTRAIAVW